VSTSAHGNRPAPRSQRGAGLRPAESSQGSSPDKGIKTKDFLIESDLLVDFLRGVEGAKAALEKAANEGVLRLSAVSAAEVTAAARASTRKDTTKLIESFGIVPVDREVALLAGLYLAGDNRSKLELGDCIVAASCHKLGAVLMTKGRRRYPNDDFETIVASY
jgi:predicted nucleic acid-binding protein